MRNALVVLLVLSATRVFAQSPPAEGDEQTSQLEAAREAFFEGTTRLHADRFAQGRDLLQESMRLSPTAGTAFNLALAYRGTGQALAGRNLIDALLRGDYGELQDRAAAESLRAELDSMVGRVDVENTHRVEIEVTFDARDDYSVAPTATESIELDAGEHSVSARAPGRLPFEGSLEVAVDHVATLRIAMDPVPVRTITRERRRPLRIVGVVAASVLVVTGAILAAVLLTGRVADPQSDATYGNAQLP